MTVVFDIDGVVADATHREHFLRSKPKDWDGFFAACPADAPVKVGLDLLRGFLAEHDVVWLTGRPERIRTQTEDWLAQHATGHGRLVMRGDTDRRQASVYKVQHLQQLKSQTAIELFVDDDPRCVQYARAIGVESRLADWVPRWDS